MSHYNSKIPRLKTTTASRCGPVARAAVCAGDGGELRATQHANSRPARRRCVPQAVGLPLRSSLVDRALAIPTVPPVRVFARTRDQLCSTPLRPLPLFSLHRYRWSPCTHASRMRRAQPHHQLQLPHRRRVRRRRASPRLHAARLLRWRPVRAPMQQLALGQPRHLRSLHLPLHRRHHRPRRSRLGQGRFRFPSRFHPTRSSKRS